MILEACVGNLPDAVRAETLGAHQIELCDRLDLDGTSPSIETINQVCTQLSIPVKAIINPNPFEYIYSTSDIHNILTYIDQLNQTSIQGIVFGPLTKEGLPDLKAIETVANQTDLPITYHKAIDASADILKSIELLKDQNIVRFILSSGGGKTAIEGKDQLLRMKAALEDSSIKLIGAGKITAANLNALHKELNLSHYHGKRIVGDLST